MYAQFITKSFITLYFEHNFIINFMLEIVNYIVKYPWPSMLG